MTKISKLILCLSMLFLVACKQNPNGSYLIYKTETPPDYELGPAGHDENASAKLRQIFKGKQLSLEFHPEYVVLKEENEGQDMILNKVVSDSKTDIGYELEYFKGKEKVNLSLNEYLNPDNVKVLSLSVVIHKLVPDPRGVLREDTYARILCNLEKYKSSSPTNNQSSSYFNDVNGIFPSVQTQSSEVTNSNHYYPTADSTVLDTVVGGGYSNTDSMVLDTVVR